MAPEDFTRFIKSLSEELAEVQKIARPGLKLEFGVGGGNSFKYIARTWPRETVWGFDSLIGLPEPWVKADDRVKPAGAMTRGGELPRNLEVNARLVAGYFADTLPAWWAEHRGPISFLHIDSDLYSSAKFVLDTLDNWIVQDTIIRFDNLCDWKGRYPKWREGEWRALTEWLGTRRVEPLWRNGREAATLRVCSHRE